MINHIKYKREGTYRRLYVPFACPPLVKERKAIGREEG
jgi:hypothetical protein